MARYPLYAAEWGGTMGGRSKPNVELVTTLALIKAARLDFIVIAPGVKLIRQTRLTKTYTYRRKRRFDAIPLTLHNNVCLGKSPRSQGDPKIVYGHR
jgi:hypothetical protein